MNPFPLRRWHSVYVMGGGVVMWSSHFTEYRAARKTWNRKHPYHPRGPRPSKNELLFSERLRSDVWFEMYR
jgi:hypothetical protein